MPDFVTSPAQTIRERFSTSISGGQPEPPIPSFQLGAAPSILQPSPLPAPTSPEQIQGLFGPLVSAAEMEQPFPGREVPGLLNPWMVFAGALAANMGTALTRNPLFAQQFAQSIEEDQRRRQAIEDENYANQLLFSKEKRTRLFAIRGQVLERQLDEAIKANDFTRAQTAAANLEKLRETMQRALLPEKAELAEREIRIRGEEERKAIKFRAELERTTGVAGKPLTMDQYLDAKNSLLKTKGVEGTEDVFKLFGIIGIPFLGKQPTSKTDLNEKIDAAAITGGEPAVAGVGRRNLLLSIARRLKIDPTRNLTPDELKKIQVEFEKYGLTL